MSLGAECSAEALKKIQHLLPEMHGIAFYVNATWGPGMTANEIADKAEEEGLWKSKRHNFNSRCGELRDMGVFYEIEKRECMSTHHTAIAWGITWNLPVKSKLEKIPGMSKKSLQTMRDLWMRSSDDEREYIEYVIGLLRGDEYENASVQ